VAFILVVLVATNLVTSALFPALAEQRRCSDWELWLAVLVTFHFAR
jgi:hypothetical protein